MRGLDGSGSQMLCEGWLEGSFMCCMLVGLEGPSSVLRDGG